MRELVFTGDVRSNMGKFSNMRIPGRKELPQAPENWPLTLCPGSMNIGLSDDGFPAKFQALGEKEGVKKLDEGNFVPEFIIPYNDIANNSLAPKAGSPLRGYAQVWRAIITVPVSGRSAECWLLRRIDSGIKRQIELVSEKRLKTELGVDDGAAVVVKVLEGAARKSE